MALRDEPEFTADPDAYQYALRLLLVYDILRKLEFLKLITGGIKLTLVGLIEAGDEVDALAAETSREELRRFVLAALKATRDERPWAEAEDFAAYVASWATAKGWIRGGDDNQPNEGE